MVFDAAAAAAVLGVGIVSSRGLEAACGGAAGRAALQTPLWPSSENIGGWRGLDWPQVLPDAAAYDATPADLLAAYGRADGVFTSPVYRDLRNPGLSVMIERYLASPALPAFVRDSSAACLLIGNPFYAVNVALMPGQFERAAAALRPVPWLDAAVEEWLGADAGAVIAVHLRLTDMIGHGAAPVWGDRCADASTRAAAIAELRAFIAKHGLLHAATVLLFATDDAAAECSRAVLAAVPSATVRLLDAPAPGSLTALAGRAPLGESGCLLPEFIQEALARRSQIFFGSSLSTFSTAVHALRVARYGRALNTSWLA